MLLKLFMKIVGKCLLLANDSKILKIPGMIIHYKRYLQTNRNFFSPNTTNLRWIFFPANHHLHMRLIIKAIIIYFRNPLTKERTNSVTSERHIVRDTHAMRKHTLIYI